MYGPLTSERRTGQFGVLGPHTVESLPPSPRSCDFETRPQHLPTLPDNSPLPYAVSQVNGDRRV